ncbi:MAG: hypothetical protein ISS48_00590 [Candidatus Aenigmarchaeota archaeon]|nr:hypothetical protein [Candidatus Aenigmarchaeota archaeon]
MNKSQENIPRSEECECYELPEGKIFIGYSDEKLSIGYLELNSRQQLSKHKRPVDEELIQLEGTSVVRIFKSHSVGEVVLLPATTTTIPANKFHMHINETNQKSLTFWKFEGDITEIIDNIRKKYKKLN